MKISVVIPVYNGERWIAQCIENVLCQTHGPIEIVVVDDGSTDGTAAVAGRYPGVRVIALGENRGQSVARNAGIDAATGEWIHFMDADDLIPRDYYARMVEALAGVEGVDMVFGGIFNQAQPGYSLTYDDRLLLTSLEDRMGVSAVADMGFVPRYLIRSEFVRAEGLEFPTGRLIEDLPFAMEAVARAARIVTAPGATYYYMRRAGSVLNSRDGEHRRRVARDYSAARAFRRDFLLRHGLGTGVAVRQVVQWKILGIPVIRRVERVDGKTRWYLFGLRVLQRKYVRF